MFGIIDGPRKQQIAFLNGQVHTFFPVVFEIGNRHIWFLEEFSEVFRILENRGFVSFSLVLLIPDFLVDIHSELLRLLTFVLILTIQ